MARSSHNTDPRLGSTVAGSFRLLKVLGQGSYATCYLAEQLGMERHAVVKIAHEHLLKGTHSGLIRDRFAAELRASTRVNHPNIATVYNSGETPDGLPLIAMEYVSGENLYHILSAHAPLPRRFIGTLFGQLLQALDTVHEAGIIHRDVTPHNIMVTTEHKAMLLDFGVAQVDTGSGHTMGPIGTPRYIAPEQIEGKAVPSSDLFSLGCILWWALTGQEYLGHLDNVGELLSAQLRAVSPPDPREYRPSIPEPVARVVMGLLHPKPSRRPQAHKLLGLWDRLISVWESIETGAKRSSSSLPAIQPRPISSVSNIAVTPPPDETAPTLLRSHPSNANTLRDNSPFHILLVGRNKALRNVARNLLHDVMVEDCEDLADALLIAQQHTFNLIICCCPMNDANRETAKLLHLLRSQGQDAPALMLGVSPRPPASLDNTHYDHYFALPVQGRDLQEVVTRYQAPPPPQQDADVSLLDSAVVASLRAQGNLENRISYAIGIIPEWLSEIEDALDHGDVYIAEALCRQIERAALTLGARRFARTAHALQESLMTQTFGGLPARLEALEVAYHEVFRALLALRETRASL